MPRVTASAGLLAALLLFAGAARAEEAAGTPAEAEASSDYGRDGVYLGLGFAYQIPLFDQLSNHIKTASKTLPTVSCSTCVFAAKADPSLEIGRAHV